MFASAGPPQVINPEEVASALRDSPKGRLPYHRESQILSPADVAETSEDDENVIGMRYTASILKSVEKPAAYGSSSSWDNDKTFLDTGEMVEASLSEWESMRKTKVALRMTDIRNRFSQHIKDVRRTADEELATRLERLSLQRQKDEDEMDNMIRESKARAKKEMANKLKQDIELQDRRRNRLLDRIKSVQDSSKLKILKKGKIAEAARMLEALEDAKKTLGDVRLERQIMHAHGLDVSKVACDAANLSEEDSLELAEGLATKLENGTELIAKVVVAIKAQAETKSRAEAVAQAETKARAEAVAQAEAKAQADAQAEADAQADANKRAADVQPGENGARSGGNREQFESAERFTAEFGDRVKSLADEKSAFKALCQKAIINNVNAIGPTNPTLIGEKMANLAKLLRGESIEVSGQGFAAGAHPLGLDYCTDLLSKKFVSLAEEVVSVHPASAFSMAAVVIALWSEFPVFGRLFLGHLYRRCPYLVPFHPDDDGSKAKRLELGYRYSDDGKLENRELFVKRMSGMAHLYAAVAVSSLPRRLESANHPHGLGNVWRWLVAASVLRPIKDVTATLLCDVLEVAGSDLLDKYGKQFRKLLKTLQEQFLVRIKEATPEGSSGGPVNRLQELLRSAIDGGTIRQMKGVIERGVL